MGITFSRLFERLVSYRYLLCIDYQPMALREATTLYQPLYLNYPLLVN